MATKQPQSLTTDDVEEIFDTDDLTVIGPGSAKPKNGGGGQGGQGGGEPSGEEGEEGEEGGKGGKPGNKRGKGKGAPEGDGDDDINPEDAGALDKNQGDDHSKHGAGGEDETDDVDEEDLESHSQRSSKKAGQRQDDAQGQDGSSGKQTSSGGRGSAARSTPQAVDWSGIKPRYDWKTLITRLVRGSESLEPTYQKIHRRNITSVHVAAQTGAGAVRPGEKEFPSSLVKLCIVVDSSGSMGGSITTVLSNVNKLLSEGGVARSFVFVEFSGGYNMYVCTANGKSGTAREIKSAAEARTGGGGKIESMATILARHEGGATNFTTELVNELSTFANQNYNILILTDTDIAGGGNREAFLELYSKHHQKVFLIFDSKHSFQACVKTMKTASSNMSHL